MRLRDEQVPRLGRAATGAETAVEVSEPGLLERIYTGSRRHSNLSVVGRELRLDQRAASELTLRLFVAVGDCPSGVDAEVRGWCRSNLHEADWDVYEADWERHGNPAGPIRNREMVQATHLIGAKCVAFPLRGPWRASKGAWDCVTAAFEAGLPVDIVPPDAPRFIAVSVPQAMKAMQ